MKLQNNLRVFAATLATLSLTVGVLAQNVNLVPNSGFEDTNINKLRTYGQMEEYSMDWFSATQVPADIYGDGAKGDKIAIPVNNYGTQEPASGLCYAGFRAYSKDPRLSRSYLEVKLPQMLDRDVMYCISFDISLADLSRYAVNDIGVLISDRKIDQPNEGDMIMQADVNQKTNKVFEFYEGWDKFCGTFVGTGQEEYMVIGCFGGRNDMTIEKIKRPMGLTGAQINHAYYYIDNVEITEIQAKSQCVCSAAEERDMDLVYGSSSVQSDDMTDGEIIKSSSVYYAFLKRTPTGTGKQTVADIAAILNANPGMHLKIIGHCDDDERNEGMVNARYKVIGKNRGDQIRRILEAAGIPASRMTISDIGNLDPANTRDTEISRAQNRRVTFELK
ncbi:MAG TPA: OmpA family protein [Flavobacteriales bacterium]|jgi:outer membrane protein OmpA-like peptidoglycan-associated protein|nr:OmpA family protein [Flavobacteriales bacterium]HIO59440.1 OmpA family protein [Flavobacteriales bacterium]